MKLEEDRSKVRMQKFCCTAYVLCAHIHQMIKHTFPSVSRRVHNAIHEFRPMFGLTVMQVLLWLLRELSDHGHGTF